MERSSRLFIMAVCCLYEKACETISYCSAGNLFITFFEVLPLHCIGCYVHRHRRLLETIRGGTYVQHNSAVDIFKISLA